MNPFCFVLFCFFVHYAGRFRLLQCCDNGNNPTAVFPRVCQEHPAASLSSCKNSRDGQGVCGFPNRESSKSKCPSFSPGSTSPETPLMEPCQLLLWNIWNVPPSDFQYVRGMWREDVPQVCKLLFSLRLKYKTNSPHFSTAARGKGSHHGE